MNSIFNFEIFIYISGIASLACATALGGGAAVAVTNNSSITTHPSDTECLADATNDTTNSNSSGESQALNSPTTPNSTASTAQLISPPLSPLAATDLDHIDSETESSNMPAKSHQPIPVIVTTTTTAQIMDVSSYTVRII